MGRGHGSSKSQWKSKGTIGKGKDNKRRETSETQETTHGDDKSSHQRWSISVWLHMLSVAILIVSILISIRSYGKTTGNKSSSSSTSSSVSQPECESKADGSCSSEQSDDDIFVAAPTSDDFTRRGSYELIETKPHDPQSFTQGLELKNSTHFYESKGMYKDSAIRIVEIQTGKVVKETKLDDAYFGEGVTLCYDVNSIQAVQLILLTWKELTAFRIHPETLEIMGTFNYTTVNGQGWGIACDNENKQIFVTDGTPFLHIWNSTTMEPISRQEITYRWPNQPSPSLLQNPNELEWEKGVAGNSGGTILANVWYQDVLVRIHPQTGFVLRIYDLQGLRPKQSRGPKEDCLNGIALDRDEKGLVLWVTGKNWPEMYKIRLVDL